MEVEILLQEAGNKIALPCTHVVYSSKMDLNLCYIEAPRSRKSISAREIFASGF